jgi:hypothetical protein
MNITVNVDEVSLDTVVAEVLGYDHETGESYPERERTIGDIVAEKLLERVINHDRGSGYQGLLTQVREIRAEVIREAVRPQVEEAIAAPVQKTNSYGDPIGEPTSLRDLIVAEARKAVNEPADRYSSRGGSFLQQAIEKAVKDALADEIKSAVEAARKGVAGEIGKTVAAAVDAGLKAR